MINIIKYIIDKYGTNRIHYSLVIFANEPSVKISFQERVTDPEQLKVLLDNVPRSSFSGSNFEKAIAETKKLFNSDAVRPDARKVAVIMTDVRDTGNRENAKIAARDLEDNGIEVFLNVRPLWIFMPKFLNSFVLRCNGVPVAI